jgi:hypothetical protein
LAAGVSRCSTLAITDKAFRHEASSSPTFELSSSSPTSMMWRHWPLLEAS